MNETREVVEEFYRRATAGEFDRMGELFADRVDWHVYGDERVPWTGSLATRAEAVRFFRDLPGHLKTESLTVEKILVDGPDAVAIGHMRHIVRATGRVFDTAFAFRFTVENGQITRYIPHEDSLALSRAYVGSGAD